MKALVLLLLLAGCPSRTDTYVIVRAYAAPQTTSFVTVYHPWSVEAAGKTTGALAAIEGFVLTCPTNQCQKRSSDASVLIEKATGASVVVSKDGFEPVTITVPPTAGQRTYLVLLRAVVPK